MNQPIKDLRSELRAIADLESILGLLEWDQQVHMPSGGQTLRAQQVESLTKVVHDASTSDRLGRLIDAAHYVEAELDADQKTILTEASKTYLRLSKIPEAFAAKKAALQSQAYQTWLLARDADDFTKFIPDLETQIELCKEEADFVGSHDSSYGYMVDHFDPGMTPEVIDSVFEPLAPQLKALCARVEASQKETIDLSQRDFDESSQKTFLLEVVRRMGFDFDHGRIDTSVHPFCSGNGMDIRMTTRYKLQNPLDSLYSSIHETGHALYEQGLDANEFGNALGSDAGMSVHESQSRLWENQIARSEAFWQFWWPRHQALFGDALRDVSFDQWLKKVLEVRRIPIRVDSDEVSYNLHVFIRYDLERGLFDGSIEVKDLRDAWNAKYEDYLGLTPENDKVGVLQDVHWASGAFGYFPSYTMGTVISAQLWDAIAKNFHNLDDLVKDAHYQPILEWLRNNVHSVGRRLSAQDLVKAATGETLSEQPLIDYLTNKYISQAV
jgi:carboxypeptidase Taq